ncbi:hypothetical protein GCM10027578_22360 [Spirosoma luteolum]
MENPQPNQLGIDEARDLIRFIGRLVLAITRAKEDGRVNLKDVKFLLPVIGSIKPAFDGLNDAWDELRELTDDENAELTAVFAQEARLPLSADTERLMRRALATGTGLIAIIRTMGHRPTEESLV